MKKLIAISYVWALPLALIGLILLPFYGPTEVRLYKGVVEFRVRRIIGYASTIGQTWGWIVMYKVVVPLDSLPKRLIAHEHAHVLQGRVLGVLFIPAYLIASLVAWVQGKHIYRDNWFEVRARKAEPSPL